MRDLVWIRLKMNTVGTKFISTFPNPKLGLESSTVIFYQAKITIVIFQCLRYFSGHASHGLPNLIKSLPLWPNGVLQFLSIESWKMCNLLSTNSLKKLHNPGLKSSLSCFLHCLLLISTCIFVSYGNSLFSFALHFFPHFFHIYSYPTNPPPVILLFSLLLIFFILIFYFNFPILLPICPPYILSHTPLLCTQSLCFYSR